MRGVGYFVHADTSLNTIFVEKSLGIGWEGEVAGA